jgi:hypothetical protein
MTRKLAFTLGLALSASFCAAQVAPTVYVNPRAGNDDPRVGLKAGLYDAGEAAMGVQKITSLPKPNGFAPDLALIAAMDAAPPPDPNAPRPRPNPNARSPYGTTNSDLAFVGHHIIVGNYYGVNFYDASDPLKVKLESSLICPGGQGDVTVYGHLLFMSVEAANGRQDCGTQGIPLPEGYVAPTPPPPPPGAPAGMRRPPEPPPSPDRIKGIRIFDITDVTKPQQVALVQTCRGSHTNTLVTDPNDKENVYIYISGSAGVRPTAELAGCSGKEDDPDTALYTIVIIKVPLAHPELAKVVASPHIFADPATGTLNALWKGGDHGAGTQTTSSTRGCHDITIFASMGLAAGACSGNGILLDIHDPVHPVRLDAVSDPNYAFWHSANFANDGSKVLFTDEWGGGGQPRCRASDPMNWGADAIFKLTADKKLVLQSYYKMPAPQTENENCVAHNGSLIPIPGRDILVQSWYQGGVSIVDFTDATHPMEIGYFDRGPVNGKAHAMGGQWSTYWYNGYIYGSEIARGLDVLKLVPSKFVTQNEIDAANLVHYGELNVQNQPKITWPANYIVAKAYLDQLARGTSLPANKIAAIDAAIDKRSKKDMSKLAAELDKTAPASPADANRLKAVSAILKGGGATGMGAE